jgi:hypothetical protein
MLPSFLLSRRALHEGGGCDDRDLPERIEREQIGVAGDDHIGPAADGQLQNLSSVGSRHAAIRSAIVTRSAAAISFFNQARASGSISRGATVC